MNVLRQLSLITFVALATTLFQNCSGFEALTGSGSLSSEEVNIDNSVPLQDAMDPNCTSSSAYDICIYKKSPVSQAGRSISSRSDLQSIQHFGVKLRNLNSSGLLQNGSISITTLDSENSFQVSQDVGTLASTDDAGKIDQAMVYYWLNQAIDFMGARGAELAVKDKNITVILDDKLAGWNPTKSTIHMMKKSDTQSMALDAGIAVYYLAQANLHFASNGMASKLDANKHQACGKSSSGCCKSATGCAKAIESGVADYMVAAMFPEDPQLGETWLNRTDGAGYCGLSRNLEQFKSVNAQQAYGACEAKGGSGEVHVLGSLYASIWWEVRKQAKEADLEGAKNIDRLYLEHLALLTGADDFMSALGKIQQADQENFEGQFSPLFQAEFEKRGL